VTAARRPGTGASRGIGRLKAFAGLGVGIEDLTAPAIDEWRARAVNGVPHFASQGCTHGSVNPDRLFETPPAIARTVP
jgi:hypothetical protein